MCIFWRTSFSPPSRVCGDPTKISPLYHPYWADVAITYLKEFHVGGKVIFQNTISPSHQRGVSATFLKDSTIGGILKMTFPSDEFASDRKLCMHFWRTQCIVTNAIFVRIVQKNKWFHQSLSLSQSDMVSSSIESVLTSHLLQYWRKPRMTSAAGGSTSAANLLFDFFDADSVINQSSKISRLAPIVMLYFIGNVK